LSVPRTPYDESLYLNALNRRGSPLIARMASTAQDSVTEQGVKRLIGAGERSLVR
jgi:hypothetical protein